MNIYPQQRGVALITAMVITTIAITIAATLAYRQQVSIRLAGNLSALNQAYAYASGIEDWAGLILKKDLRDSAIDSCDEDWASLLPPIPIPGGQMTGQLYDLQARLNINDIVEPVSANAGHPGQQTDKPNPVQLERLRSLLGKLGLQPNQAEAILDWVDRDPKSSPTGAEDNFYRAQIHPYLTPDTALASPTELRLVKDMLSTGNTNHDADQTTVYEKILPFIATLPRRKGKTIPVNVNTAPIEVLLSLGITDAQARNVISDRETNPFDSVSSFISSLQSTSNNTNTDINKQISVTSQYFLLNGKVEIGRARIFLNSILHRDGNGKITIISREFSNNTHFPAGTPTPECGQSPGSKS
jgi:general secretion pathway protein K